MTEEEKSGDGTPQYADLVIEEGEREVDIEEEYEGGSLTEQEEITGSVSDFNLLLRELNPTLKNKRLAELLATGRVSRIFPDNFLDKFGITVGMLVMEQDTSIPFGFIDFINHIQDGYSFGYEGRGIADMLEAFGAVKEEELNKLSKDLGL